MHLSLKIALLCVGQLAAAKQQSRTEGFTDLSDVRSRKHLRWRTVDEVAFREGFDAVLQLQTMAAAAGNAAVAVPRVLGTTNGSSIQTPLFNYSVVKKKSPFVDILPAWYRNLGEADVDSFALTSEIPSSGVSKPNNSHGSYTDLDSQHADAYRLGRKGEAEAQRNTSASQEVEEHNNAQRGNQDAEGDVGTKKPHSSHEAREGSLCDHLKSLVVEGPQPGYEYREQDTRGEVNDSSEGGPDVNWGTEAVPGTSGGEKDVNWGTEAVSGTSGGEKDVNWGTEAVSGTSGGENHAARDGKALQSSSTIVDALTVSDNDESSEEEQEAEGNNESSSELRDLGRRRNYAAAIPVKFPSIGTATAPQQTPKLSQRQIPAAPTKILHSKQLTPPPKKVLSYKKVFPPPKKVRSVQKVHPPLEVVRMKKVAPSPKNYFAPKKVAYPKKKALSKKVHRKYVLARKKYIPPKSYVPAPKKFAPAPVYVPAPKKL